MGSESSACGDLIVGGYHGEAPTPRFTAAIARGERAGAILFKRNGRAPIEMWRHTRALTEAAGDRRLVLAVDQEGGRVERIGPPLLQLPAARRLAAACELPLVELVAETQARELAAVGFSTSFAPVLDVASEPKNPIIGDRAFGETAEAAIPAALAFARGLERGRIFACGKHFPGHGATQQDSHLELPVVSRAEAAVRAVDVEPFARAAAAAMPAMMSAHVVFTALDPERPATLSRAICTDLLRGELRFTGVLFSDDLEMKALTQPVEETAVLAVAAGCDMLLVCSDEDAQDRAYAALVREAERSEAFRARVAEAAARSRDLRERFAPAPCRTEAELADALGRHEAVGKALAERLEALAARGG
ncbi:MAG: beta-N-acetylhexosaminidase [Myxococcales bacterium]|nr:beta-N-acetylhexosaminidase [Myxococcales bacterium]